MKRREGMALLTVLLLIAVMSVMAVSVLDDIRFGVRRNLNARAVAQAQWYALGAEQLAQAQIRRLASREVGRTTLAGGWNGRVFVFPLDDGTIRGRVRDGGNCFNLNSLVQGSGDLLIRRDQGVRQFVSLLAALDVPRSQAETLAAVAVDWMDQNESPESGGAEDDAYLRGAAAHRTGGTLMAEASELRGLRGVTPQLYARLRPFVCALPSNDLSPININTLLERDAVLLTMLTDGRLSVGRARQLISERLPGGWAEGFQMFNSLELGALPPEVFSQVGVRTTFFSLEAEVEHA